MKEPPKVSQTQIHPNSRQFEIALGNGSSKQHKDNKNTTVSCTTTIRMLFLDPVQYFQMVSFATTRLNGNCDGYTKWW